MESFLKGQDEQQQYAYVSNRTAGTNMETQRREVSVGDIRSGGEYGNTVTDTRAHSDEATGEAVGGPQDHIYQAIHPLPPDEDGTMGAHSGVYTTQDQNVTDWPSHLCNHNINQKQWDNHNEGLGEELFKTSRRMWRDNALKWEFFSPDQMQASQAS